MDRISSLQRVLNETSSKSIFHSVDIFQAGLISMATCMSLGQLVNCQNPKAPKK